MAKQKIKDTKEFKELLKAIRKLINKHKGRIDIACSMIAWKDDNYNVDETNDESLIAFGNKEALIISLKDMLEQIKKDKDEFINW